MNFVVAAIACSAASATVKPIFWLEDILRDSYNVTDAIATMLLSD